MMILCALPGCGTGRNISHCMQCARVKYILFSGPGLGVFPDLAILCSTPRCRYHWGSLFCAPYIGNFVWLDLDVMLALSFDMLIVW